MIENSTKTDVVAETTITKILNLSKKQLVIGGIILATAVIILFAFLYESEFERVKNQCVHIAGMVSGGNDDYFIIDTSPESVIIPNAEACALEAIKYANKELDFNEALYSKMLNTSALMGRQSEENDRYKVSWTYHPDNGLEVTYEKK